MAKVANDVWADHAAHLDALADSLGDACPKFVWPASNPMPDNFGTYRALPGSVFLKRDASAGGMSLDADLRLTFTTAQFGAGPFPKSRDLIGYSGKLFRIVSRTDSPNGYQCTVEANDASQNA
jgi:hypothetical protein